MALLASVLEVAGAVAVYLLLALVADPGGEIDLPLVGDLRARVPGMDEQSLLLTLAVVLAGFFRCRPRPRIPA